MVRRKIIIVFLVVFCFPFVLLPLLPGAQLQPVKTIGNDDDDDFIFSKIRGGFISADKSIFVIDLKGHSVSKFDWNGKFITKIGKIGKGPGCFLNPVHLDSIGDKLLFLDSLNFRTVETDLDLKNIKYNKLPSNDIYLNSFLFLDKLQYIGAYLSTQDDGGYHFIKHTNLEKLSENTFFENTVVPINKKKFHMGKLSFFLPVIGLDRAKKRLVIGYSCPDKNMEFFVRSLDGKCIDSFSYTLDKDYLLPEFIKQGTRAPKDFTWIQLYKIFVYKNQYIIHVGKARIKNRWPVENEMKKYLLIFDSKTKVLTHKLSAPPTIHFFSISEDGFLIGADDYEEIPKVHIYKLDL